MARDYSTHLTTTSIPKGDCVLKDLLRSEIPHADDLAFTRYVLANDARMMATVHLSNDLGCWCLLRELGNTMPNEIPRTGAASTPITIPNPELSKLKYSSGSHFPPTERQKLMESVLPGYVL